VRPIRPYAASTQRSSCRVAAQRFLSAHSPKRAPPAGIVSGSKKNISATATSAPNAHTNPVYVEANGVAPRSAAEARAFLKGSDGELILAGLTPAGYREHGRASIIGPTWAHPAYAGDCVYARDDRELVCVLLR
jgi:hypothetical protein